MSQENVELVRQAFEHFLETGEPRWDTIDPEVEVHDHDIPDARPYRGHQGYANWLADWGSAWSNVSYEAKRWLDVGDKVVLVLQLTAKGRGSGVEVKRRDAMVLTIRERKMIRLDYYNDEAQALEAVGLSEYAMSQENVEIVRTIHSRWHRGEGDAIEFFAPHIEWSSPHPDGGAIHGRDELHSFLRRYAGTWEEFRHELESVPFFSESGRGKGSGVVTQLSAAAIWTLEAGKVVRFQAYPDRADALEAAGLQE
jgi:ketosteroid isomerase-like protein